MNKLITITGTSFSGKSTIESFLVESNRIDVNKIVSTTSRARRVDESHSAYHFVTKAEFMELVTHNELLEHSTTNGQFYGITKSAIAQSYESFDTVAVVVDPNGVKALSLYCKANDIELVKVYVNRKFLVCLNGLVKRLTTGEVSFMSGLKRLVRFITMEYWWRFNHYDVVIQNNRSLEDCFNTVSELCFKTK